MLPHFSGIELWVIVLAALGYLLPGAALITFIWFLIKTVRASAKRDFTAQQLSEQLIRSMQDLHHQQDTMSRSMSSIEQRLASVETVLKQVE